MKHQHKPVEESETQVPAYIVTFSDMITLLLTFFVMLLSLASVQDPELVDKGRDSFVESVTNFGLGVLAGKKFKANFGSAKIKYFIANPDNTIQNRCIDAKQEDLRRLFQKVSRSMKTIPSQIVAKKTNFSVTSIRFPPGDAILNEQAKKFLTEFCTALQQQENSKVPMLYVLGLCDEQTREKNQWMLSARRAQAVADFMRDILPCGSDSQTQQETSGSPLKWPVYSWGAGSGGDWVAQDSPISGQSQILIAVLRQ